MACLMSRGLMSGWTGTHNPTYKADQLDASTEPSTSWSAVSFSGPCNGYLLGFGQLYMNYKSDESGGRIDYTSSAATDNPLLAFLRNMLTLQEAGAVIMPFSPGFYLRPQTLDELLRQSCGRIFDQLGLPHRLGRWGEALAQA